LITPDKIYCSNAGDSRGMLNRGGKVVELSYDHKPDNRDELARITKAGHFVEDSRVDGNLALSRAFGDC
jgi:protein phosphatase 2C family protein 2/3